MTSSEEADGHGVRDEYKTLAGGDLSLECHLRVGFCENEQRRGLWLKGPSGYLIGAAIEESGRA